MVRVRRVHGRSRAALAMTATAALLVGGAPAVSGETEGVLIGVLVIPAPPERAVTLEARQADLRSTAGDRVFFSEGSAALGARARVVLAAQADWLRRHPDYELAIEGHADEPGGNAVNQALSLKRAEAVRGRLIELGVSPERLGAVARGAADPVAVCAEAVCATQNRRAVSRVIGTEPGPHVEAGLPPAPGAMRIGRISRAGSVDNSDPATQR